MIRTRLTLWNTVVFAFALALIGVLIYVTTEYSIYKAVDDELVARAAGMQRMWKNGPGGPHHGPGNGDPDMGPRIGEIMRAGFGGPDGPPPGEGRVQIPYLYPRRGPMPFFPDGKGNHERDWLAALTQGMDTQQAQELRFFMRISNAHEIPLEKGPWSEEHGPGDKDRHEAFDRLGLAKALAGETGFTSTYVEGHHVRVYSFPRRIDGRVKLVGQVAASLGGADRSVHQLGITLLELIPLALIATSILGVWLTNRALQPVKEIAATAERLGAEHLSDRLPVRGKDEFALLSSQFNSMLDRIEGSFRRLGEAYEAQRRFIADASHELKTPLTTVKGRVGVALRGTHSPERYGEHLRAIGRAADSMSTIISDLLLLARSDEAKLSLRRSPNSVESLVVEAVMAATSAQPRPIEVDVPEELTVSADPPLFTRALLNLLSNAIRHTPSDRKVAVRACGDASRVRIEILDEGEGIPAEHLPLIFDRFHRVDPSRDRASGGTGLGLSIVRSIVEAHEGTISVESEVGRGTVFAIEMPAA